MKNLSAKIMILLLTTSLGLLAQNTPKQTAFRFGIHASPNFSYIASSDPGAQSSLKIKFGFGLIAEYNFAENYSLSTGIDYVMRGGELTITRTNDLGNNVFARKGTYNSGFIQLPILLKMRTREFGYFRYFAEFGGSVDISTDEQTDFKPIILNPHDSYVPLANVMFTIGVGTEYSLGGQTSLLLGLYYNRSLIDNLNNYSEIGTQKKYSYRFDYVSLKLGVLF